MPAQIDESILEQQLSELETAHYWNPRVISKLETFIRTADDYDLFRINPLQYGSTRGLSNAEIAVKLRVSDATVKTHINHLLAKTRMRDRAQLVAYAELRGYAAAPHPMHHH